jgi:hypothetical protein
VTSISQTSAPYSSSVLEAFRWAGIAARIRERTAPGQSDPVINTVDLFLGTLLAPANEGAELNVMLVILEHFNVTARDVVGDAYPAITPDSLQTAAEQALPGTGQPDDNTILSNVIVASRSYGGGFVQLPHLIGAMLLATSDLWAPLEGALSSIGESREAIAASYQQWMSTWQPSTVAGVSLRSWLSEHNPRTPASIAGFSSDNVDGQVDLIGVSPEANALAYLIASRDLTPPLAIGLFGEWGSGKSFLMRFVEGRVQELTKMAELTSQAEASVWKSILQIRFSAWEYVQGDLWAGLLERIFEDLGRKVEPGLVQSRTAVLKEDLDKQNVVVSRAEAQRAELESWRASAEKVVEAAQKDVEDERARAQQNTDQLAADSKKAADAALKGIWSQARVQALGSDASELFDALAEARRELQRGRTLLGPYWRSWIHVILLTGTVLVIPLVTFLLQLAGVPTAASVMGGLAAVVPLVTAGLRSFTTWTQEQLRLVDEAQADVRARFEAPLKEAEAALADAQAKLGQVKLHLATQNAEVAVQQARAQAIDEEIDALTPGRVFVEFADVRSLDYRRRLGLLATVRSDLRQMQGEIHENNQKAIDPQATPAADAKIPNRVVLYIDDLDRCPPAKVLQVLEAVHLLLAFEQFVVVVAVDQRWLRSALIRQLPALSEAPSASASVGEREDRPTVQDYVEKIFQLPLWVQPVKAAERTRIVTGLLSGSVRAPRADDRQPQGEIRVGPSQEAVVKDTLAKAGTGLLSETSPLALTAEELAFIGSLGPILGDTPRRVKRFVNTVQLLLSVRPVLSGEGPTSPRLTLCLFAAIHDGLPGLARVMFSPLHAGEPVNAVVNSPEAPEPETAILREWLGVPDHAAWGSVFASSLGNRLELVRRIGFDPPGS